MGGSGPDLDPHFGPYSDPQTDPQIGSGWSSLHDRLLYHRADHPDHLDLDQGRLSNLLGLAASSWRGHYPSPGGKHRPWEVVQLLPNMLVAEVPPMTSWLKLRELPTPTSDPR